MKMDTRSEGTDAVEKRLHQLRETARQFAQAESQRVKLEHGRKAKMAVLMKQAEQAGYTTIAAQEREARASREYSELLEGLAAATEEAVRLRWELKLAEHGIELYRTQQANRRVERSGYGA